MFTEKIWVLPQTHIGHSKADMAPTSLNTYLHHQGGRLIFNEGISNGKHINSGSSGSSHSGARACVIFGAFQRLGENRRNQPNHAPNQHFVRTERRGARRTRPEASRYRKLRSKIELLALTPRNASSALNAAADLPRAQKSGPAAQTLREKIGKKCVLHGSMIYAGDFA